MFDGRYVTPESVLNGVQYRRPRILKEEFEVEGDAQRPSSRRGTALLVDVVRGRGKGTWLWKMPCYRRMSPLKSDQRIAVP